MRAVTYARNETIEIRDKPVPEIEPDEVLLRVRGAGLCHSDINIIGRGDDHPLVGSTLGHEVAGTVQQIGSETRGWSLGDNALVALVLSCGQCRECLSGRDDQCVTAYPRGSMSPLSTGIGTPGGMADYIAVKARHLDPIGDLDPIAAAPLADAALTPMHAISTVKDRLTGDACVVTIGLGGLGHLAVQLLTATTAARVIALDVDPARLEYATARGADLVLLSDSTAAERILTETAGRGAHVVLDFVGTQATVDLATSIVAPGGAIRFVGLGGGSFSYRALNTPDLPWGVNIERTYGGTRSEVREVIALAQRGRIGVEVVRYPLDDAVRAFDDLRRGRVRGRAVLVP